jgi:hypothetical protein
MRYLIVGALTMAGIVLGSIAAVDWALDGATALAWTAFGFGVLGVLVLIACLWLYARGGLGHARQDPRLTEFGYAREPYNRAQDRPWMREPHAAAGPRPPGPGASTWRPS